MQRLSALPSSWVIESYNPAMSRTALDLSPEALKKYRPLEAIRRRRAEQAAELSSRRRRARLAACKAAKLLKTEFGAKELGFTLPEAPAIPGLVFRHFRGEDDFPNIAVIINTSLTADVSKERITAEELINIYAHAAHWDPQQDILLVEVDGKLIGYANTEWREEDTGDRLHFIDLYLAAEWRCCGLELAMQRHMECCIRKTVTADPNDVHHWFVSKVPETWQTRVEMLRTLGYVPVRYYFEMQRPLLGDNLPEPVLPTGLVIRLPLPEHYRAIWEAGEECFRDQQDHVAPCEESYRTWVTKPGLDPSLWLVAWDGDLVAGAAINVIHEGAWGETDDLFVRRPWRKRGLGRALLVGSLHLFKARGLTTAGLGVDAENVSGALGLYESVGYRPYKRLASYRKPM